MTIITEVKNLTVGVVATGEEILDRVSLSVEPGQIHGLAGETGSGKTTLGLTLLGYLARGLRFNSGEITVNGEKLRRDGVVIDDHRLRALRGRIVSYVPQDPSSALNPGMKIERLFKEVFIAHGVHDSGQQRKRARNLLDSVGLSGSSEFLQRFPHQLSGGQLQRVGIAIAFALDPAVVIMDEPTTGLDVTTKQKVSNLVRSLAKSTNTAIIFVSHDLRLLLELSDEVSILLEGRVVDRGAPHNLLTGEVVPYTQKLLDALPTLDDVAHEKAWDDVSAEEGTHSLPLAVTDLSARYGKNEITHGLSFTIEPGRTLAIVGESGSGKTTLARSIAGFHDEYEGIVQLGQKPVAKKVTSRSASEKTQIQYVFQNPFGSLNPRRRVGNSIAMAVQLLGKKSRSEARSIAKYWLTRVGLSPEHYEALPVELSGGQRQRVAIARALAPEPSVLICDEVTSSLDVSVQREIVTLLQELQDEQRLSMLFITHDLGLAHWIAHETLVLLDGRAVEYGPTAEVLLNPQHTYTRRLVEAGSLRSD